jgi:hypothetical protein
MSRVTITLTASTDVIGLLDLNAFYAGDGIVVYGEGLPSGFVLSGTHQIVDYFAGGLDIVAHELWTTVSGFDLPPGSQLERTCADGEAARGMPASYVRA